MKLTFLCCADSPGDFEPQNDYQLTFNTGDTRVVRTISIVNDDICESQHEEFFSRISLFTQDRHINIAQSQTRIVILDSTERECGTTTVQNKQFIASFVSFLCSFHPFI